MNVTWVPQLARTPPPSASTLKVATCAGAQKATKEMGLIALVRACVRGGWVEAGLRESRNALGVVANKKRT